MKKPFWASYRVDLPFARYNVQCRVVPAKHAPHAGPDSPDYLRPGTRGSVQIIRILRDAIDVTDKLDKDTERRVRESCEEQAGVARSVLAAPADQAELPLEVNR